MTLSSVVKEIEKEASINGVEILVDNTALKHNFIPILSEKGLLGAVGQYLEKNKLKIGFFILNNSIYKYALEEGFEKDQIFDCFKESIFKEVDKEDFFRIMVGS